MSSPARSSRFSPQYVQWLRVQYVVERRPMADIGAELGITKQSVHQHLIAAGIPRRRRGPQPAVKHDVGTT